MLWWGWGLGSRVRGLGPEELPGLAYHGMAWAGIFVHNFSFDETYNLRTFLWK